MGKKRGRIVAIVVFLVIALTVIVLLASLWVNEGPLWREVMSEEYSSLHEALWGEVGHGYRILYKMNPQTRSIVRGKYIGYYIENGFKAKDGMYQDGLPVAVTQWNFDGTINVQVTQEKGEVVFKKSPPWLWGVQDQTEPTDPQWIAEHGKQ